MVRRWRRRPLDPSLDKAAKVHPKLQYGAQVEPNKTVRGLVQKLNTSLDLRNVTNNRGKGSVKEDFSQFSTTSVEILQKDVLELATSRVCCSSRLTAR